MFVIWITRACHRSSTSNQITFILMYFCRFFLLFHLTIFLFSLYYIAFAFSILYQYNLCVYVSIYRRGILKSTNELSNIQICNVLLLVLLLYKHKDTQCTLNTNETEKKQNTATHNKGRYQLDSATTQKQNTRNATWEKQKKKELHRRTYNNDTTNHIKTKINRRYLT